MDYEEPEQIEEVKAAPTAPYIFGASPKNGAQNLICNAFISARMDLLDNYQGVDAKSVSEESIRLYPANNPEAAVDIYITVNNGLKNILLEPREVLETNTEYIFEINSKLVDLEGVPFKTYKSRFKTGTVKLPKYISKNKPKIKVIPARKRIKLNPLPEGYLIKKPKPKEEEKEVEAAPVVAEKEESKEVVPAKPMTKKEKRDAAVAAKLAAYNAARNKKENEQEVVGAKPVSEAMAKGEDMGKAAELASNQEDKQISPKLEVEKKEELSDEQEENIDTNGEKEIAAVEEKEETKILIADISYPVKSIRKDAPLSVNFSMPEEIEIRYLIKNAAGEIVKKGIGKISRGETKKTIPTKNLPPGKYKIAIKAGDLVKNHSFSILK